MMGSIIQILWYNKTEVKWTPIPYDQIMSWDGGITVGHTKFKILVDGQCIYES